LKNLRDHFVRFATRPPADNPLRRWRTQRAVQILNAWNDARIPPMENWFCLVF